MIVVAEDTIMNNLFEELWTQSKAESQGLRLREALK